MPSFYAEIDIAVLPTWEKWRMEGCPVALLEAMAAGNPCVAASIQGADYAWLHNPAGMEWSLDEITRSMEMPVAVKDSIEDIVSGVVQKARSGDHILVMSNGAFGGVHDKLLKALG